MAALLVQGAAVTSIGVALATWFRRLGRAVAVSVTVYAFCRIRLGPLPRARPGDPDRDWPDFAGKTPDAGVLSRARRHRLPVRGPVRPVPATALPPSESRVAFYIGQVIVMLTMLVFALVVLALTLATFNRCVGRVPERPRRAPRPPRRATGVRLPRLRTAAPRRSGAPCPP